MTDKSNADKSMAQFIASILQSIAESGSQVEGAFIYDPATGKMEPLDIGNTSLENLTKKENPEAIVWKDLNAVDVSLGDEVSWRGSDNSLGRVVGQTDGKTAISWYDKNDELAFISPENAAINLIVTKKNALNDPVDLGAKGITRYLATKVEIDARSKDDCDCENCIASAYVKKYMQKSGLDAKQVIKEILYGWDNAFNSPKDPSVETAKAIGEAEEILSKNSDRPYSFVATDDKDIYKKFETYERARKWADGMEIEYDRPFTVFKRVNI